MKDYNLSITLVNRRELNQQRLNHNYRESRIKKVSWTVARRLHISPIQENHL